MNKIISQKIYFLSFFCMVLLVFIHSYNITDLPLYATSTINEPLTVTNFIEYFIANGLLRFRLPMLMMISGFLLAYKEGISYASLIKKKLQTLMLPYLLFSAINLLLLFIVEHLFMTHNNAGLWGKKIETYTLHDYIYRLIISPIPFQLWFLRVLFVFIICYPVIKYCLLNIPILLLLLLFVLRIGYNNEHFTLLFYFALGIYIQLQKLNIHTAPTCFSTTIWLIAIVIIISIKTWIAFSGQPIFGVYTSTLLQLLHVAHVIPTIVLVWFGLHRQMDYYMQKRWFLAIVGSSFFIFACHEPFMVMLIKPYGALFGSGQTAKLLGFLTLPIIMLIFCIALDAFVTKAAPKFHSVLTGGRGKRKVTLT